MLGCAGVSVLGGIAFTDDLKSCLFDCPCERARV